MLGLTDANSTEFNRATPHPVIALISEWQDAARGAQVRDESTGKGGTMRLGSQEVHIAPNTLARAIYGDETVKRLYPALVEAATVIGGVAIQGRASFGGNLCNSGPAADSVPAMIAVEGVANIAGPAGRRSVAIENFNTGPGRNVLQQGEFVVSLHFPPPAPNSGAAWQRFIPRNEMDIAVVNAGVAVRFEGSNVASAKVAIGAVGPTVLMVPDAVAALVGKPLTDETIAAAGDAAKATARPIDDMRGSIKQRRHLSKVLVERTLREAARRALGG
jgi:carbon-monoxide dehydrogenase medium subunit